MNKKRICGLVTALTLSPVFSPAMAPVMAEEVDEIVVSATGIPTPLAQIGASVDIITAEDLERQQITYLQDALKLKGINVGQNGGPGTSSNVFLRGLPGKHAMLMIDGIAIVDPQLDYPYWGDVVTDGVGQVEILRGPQGVLYGSNTIAGVISQFTAIGGDQLNVGRVEVGEYGTRRVSYTSKGSKGSADYGFGMSRFHTDGFSAAKRPTGQTASFDDDAYDNTTLNAKLRQHVGSNLFIDIVMRHAEGRLDTDSGAGSDAENNWTDFERTNGRVAINLDLGQWTHTIGLSTYDNDTIIFQNNAATTFGADTERQILDYQGVVSLNDDTQIILGLNSNEADDGSNEVDTSAVYALVQRNLSNALTITGALRNDEHDLFGSQVTYRATAAYLASNDVLLRFSHGTGYRAPSLDELYSPYAGGNQDFQPAESVSTEFGLEVDFSESINLASTAFIAEIEDAIEYSFTLGGPFGSYQQFSGTTEVSGLEVDLELTYSELLSFTADAVYTDSKKPANDGSNRLERQGRVPRVQVGLAAQFTPRDNLQLSASARHVKGAVENVGGNLTEFKDYTLIDLHGSMQVSDSVKIYGRVENAADEEYETARGYSTSGRAAYIGVTSSF